MVMRFFDMSRKPPVGELPQIGDARRARIVQRLQIGITGVTMMILLIGLASIIQDRAAQTDATAVPQAAATTEPNEGASQNDPLVEAGVVPDLPDSPVDTPAQQPAVMPETGQDAPGAQ
ncbi:hypothetical protein [Qipengyuania marisflavi]|uniref:Uncharacterized protein n=1 Tax=Qipengyuania marisflavi TaxID=2486356 RepID=A0A5S3P6P7_9SPHN|nr:hypothetical protein [Qipengyuania marisflavi]TMM48795.1 hypothetical protein FEV51_05210 [Qipengyuania marisflavi]